MSWYLYNIKQFKSINVYSSFSTHYTDTWYIQTYLVIIGIKFNLSKVEKPDTKTI